MPENIDPRLRQPGIERLRDSRAVIINIDYPLGMAAYHHLSAVALGILAAKAYAPDGAVSPIGAGTTVRAELPCGS
mgnify:CR=1 FL=1